MVVDIYERSWHSLVGGLGSNLYKVVAGAQQAKPTPSRLVPEYYHSIFALLLSIKHTAVAHSD
jgi:hypothetical protein